jgi:uncharacterized protein YqfA (UPF0365 family)
MGKFAKQRLDGRWLRALEQGKRARVVEAEAFRSGNLGMMDYYEMQNIKSDTAMRERIAGEEAK